MTRFFPWTRVLSHGGRLDVMDTKTHLDDIANNRHRELSHEEIESRIRELTGVGGSNPGQINQANQAVAEYRRELDRRHTEKVARWTLASMIAAIVAAVAAILSLFVHA